MSVGARADRLTLFFFALKVDFVKYFEAKSKERWGKRIITDLGYKHEKMILSKLREYCTEVLFREFNNEWALNFDLHLKKTLKMNSRWSVHKGVKTYLAMASKIDEIDFINPYNFFKTSTEESELEPLTKDELRT